MSKLEISKKALEIILSYLDENAERVSKVNASRNASVLDPESASFAEGYRAGIQDSALHIAVFVEGSGHFSVID